MSDEDWYGAQVLWYDWPRNMLTSEYEYSYLTDEFASTINSGSPLLISKFPFLNCLRYPKLQRRWRWWCAAVSVLAHCFANDLCDAVEATISMARAHMCPNLMFKIISMISALFRLRVNPCRSKQICDKTGKQRTIEKHRRMFNLDSLYKLSKNTDVCLI